MDELARKFGVALREMRKERKLSQEAFAFECGLNRQFVSLLELGDRAPSLATIYKLASGLKVSGSSLLADFESRSTPRTANRVRKK